MFAKVVANRYARALLHSCPDLATIERVKDELILLKSVWEISGETRGFLLNPKIPPKIKITILDRALVDKVSAAMLKFLALLIEKRRQDILPDITERYMVLTDTVRGVEHVEIVVSAPVPPELEELLLEAVQRFSTRQVEIELKIDPSIMGGVQIRLGDKVVDGSLKRRFEDIRRIMLAAPLPRTFSEEGLTT